MVAEHKALYVPWGSMGTYCLAAGGYKNFWKYVAYSGLDSRYKGGYDTISHTTKEYAPGDIHTNTAESSFALMKRGIMGIYHSVSKEYLHRYLWQFEFLWNHRKVNDGERTALAIRAAEGKRLMYRAA